MFRGIDGWEDGLKYLTLDNSVMARETLVLGRLLQAIDFVPGHAPPARNSCEKSNYTCGKFEEHNRCNNIDSRRGKLHMTTSTNRKIHILLST